MKFLILLFSLSTIAVAQHSVTLTWTPSVDGGTVNVYRANTACTTNPTTFTNIKSGVALAGPYNDTAIDVGGYCYRLTATVNGVESAVPSNTANALVLPQSPSNLVITVVK